jgi:hypothetical protein
VCVYARVCVCEGGYRARGHMRHTLKSFVAPLAAPNFFYYLIQGTIFEKAVLKIKCTFVFFLQLSSKILLTLRRI